jgi:tRNA-dihydrouridine synthase 3
MNMLAGAYHYSVIRATIESPATAVAAATAAASVESPATIPSSTTQIDEAPKDPRGTSKWQPEPITDAQLQRNAELVEKLRGQVILAPLTRGNNLPFRRLCADFGADVTTSEMAFARNLVRGKDRKEITRLRRADNEKIYGVQIATNVIDEGVKAGLMAADAGADWVDLNCGCPIYEATRRGLGSALLRKPEKLARLVAGIASNLPIPLTVKIRTGQSEGSINVAKVVELLSSTGAAAVTVHGRTALQRYKKPADWSLIENAAREFGIPLIGNGDILTHYEAQRRLQDHGCLAVMVGRGALIKPWIFQEAKEGRELNFSAPERVEVYRRLTAYMKEYFGDDEMGKRKAFYFLPWHLGFFCRSRPLPEDTFGTLSLQQPLISTRWEGVASIELGETVDSLPILERLLRCESDDAHVEMSTILWEAGSDAEAVVALEKLAAENVVRWEEEVRMSGERDGGDGRDDRAETEG